MAQVDVTINGRDYRIACEDGQEQHLIGLASYLNARVAELVREVGQIGDTRLLVMAGLLVADELSDMKDALDAERGLRQAEMAGRLDKLAGRIESLAAGMEAERPAPVASAGKRA